MFRRFQEGKRVRNIMHHAHGRYLVQNVPSPFKPRPSRDQFSTSEFRRRSFIFSHHDHPSPSTPSVTLFFVGSLSHPRWQEVLVLNDLTNSNDHDRNSSSLRASCSNTSLRAVTTTTKDLETTVELPLTVCNLISQQLVY